MTPESVTSPGADRAGAAAPLPSAVLGALGALVPALLQRDGDALTVKDADVFAEEIVPSIVFRHIANLSFGAGPPDQGIGLTGRPSNQDRVVEVPPEFSDCHADRCSCGISA